MARGVDASGDARRIPLSHWAGREHIIEGRQHRLGKLNLWSHDDNTIRDSQGNVMGHHYKETDEERHERIRQAAEDSMKLINPVPGSHYDKMKSTLGH